jgi:hypothetical protein
MIDIDEITHELVIEEVTTNVVVDGDTVSIVQVVTHETVVVEEVGATIEILEQVTTVSPTEEVISVVSVGIPGPQGPQGPPGVGEDIDYVHIQAVPASTWTIDHPLGFYPNVTVVDSLNRKCFGEVTYPSTTQVVVVFSAMFSGRAFLS